jgi:hypothetical protein
VRQEKASAEGDPYRIAECYSRLNEPDLALHWLERAFDQHSPHMWALDRDETFSSIRGDPRFKALLQRLHLS